MIVSAWREGFANYFNFEGRATRPQFWYWVLAQLLIFIVLGLTDNFLVEPALGIDVMAENPARPLSFLYAAISVIPSIAIAVRRLRDAGYSPWLILIGLIPFVNLVLIYFYAQPSSSKSES